MRVDGYLRIVTVALVFTALVAAGPGLAADASVEGESVTLLGWIVDETCGVDNANEEGAQCALDCYEAGAALVLYDEESEEIYRLDRQEVAAEHIGYVEITGRIVGDLFEVEEIRAIG